MTDDIFSQLFALFSQPGPVNWKLAEEMTRHLGGDPEPIDPWVAEEYQQLTRLAQMTIAQDAPFEVASALSGTPVDRTTWAKLNLQSFRYLVDPLGEKMAAQTPTSGGPLDAVMASIGPAMLGLQMGVTVGFLSHRVLGQFDAGLPTATDQLVYVVPNIDAFTQDNSLDSRQVRLWVALHEVTHRAELSVPWVQSHFHQLINMYMDGVTIDPTILTERLEKLQDPSQLEEMMSDPTGIGGLFATSEQQPERESIQAFVATLNGYGGYLIDEAASRMLPDLEKMRGALRLRREEPESADQMLTQTLGLELNQDQYLVGYEFCTEVSRRWGSDALNKIWDGPENFPSLAELSDPVGWAARVMLSE